MPFSQLFSQNIALHFIKTLGLISLNFKIALQSYNHQVSMNKVAITQNFVMPDFQTVNKNEDSTQLILMDPQTANLYLFHQYYCIDSDDYRQLVALLESQAVQGNQSPYVLNPVVYLPIKYTNQEYKTSHFIQVLYDYGSHTLQQQLYLRIHEQNNFFQEHQIWSIIGSCILGLKFLKENQFNHRSICLNDIFVTKDGQIKLCHPMFRTYDHSQSQQLQRNYFERVIGESYCFAPQQLSQDKIFKSQIQHNMPQTAGTIFKSDIFSLAMTIISLGVLSPISDCYVKKASQFRQKIMIDSEKIEQYLQALAQIYSQDLINILCSMLAFNPEQRVSIEQLSLAINQMIEEKHKEEENWSLKPSLLSPNAQKVQISAQSQCPSSADKVFGKFSRISQASQISGRSHRKINDSSVQKGLESLPDLQDRPSPISIACLVDCQHYDTSCTQEESLQQNQTINQTLRQYINHEPKSMNSLVNQTILCQQYQMIGKKKHGFSPQQAVSIMMTSRELGSLPDDSSSIVVEKHVVNKHQNDKENQFIQSNMISQPNVPGQNSFRMFLSKLKQQKANGNASGRQNNAKTATYIYSARNYNQLSDKSFFGSNDQGFYQFDSKPNFNTIHAPVNQSLTISLNKNYQILQQNQHKNPQNVYTDPKFLEAIRQDVNKILKKRKIKVTISDLPNQRQFTSNNIFINGQKINHFGNQKPNFINQPTNNINQPGRLGKFEPTSINKQVNVAKFR